MDVILSRLQFIVDVQPILTKKLQNLLGQKLYFCTEKTTVKIADLQ